MKDYDGKQIFDAVMEQDDVENIDVSDTGLLTVLKTCGSSSTYQMTMLQYDEYIEEEAKLQSFINKIEKSSTLKEALREVI